MKKVDQNRKVRNGADKLADKMLIMPPRKAKNCKKSKKTMLKFVFHGPNEKVRLSCLYLPQ